MFCAGTTCPPGVVKTIVGTGGLSGILAIMVQAASSSSAFLIGTGVNDGVAGSSAILIGTGVNDGAAGLLGPGSEASTNFLAMGAVIYLWICSTSYKNSFKPGLPGRGKSFFRKRSCHMFAEVFLVNSSRSFMGNNVASTNLVVVIKHKIVFPGTTRM